MPWLRNPNLFRREVIKMCRETDGLSAGKKKHCVGQEIKAIVTKMANWEDFKLTY